MKVNFELDNLEMIRIAKDGTLVALLESIKDENKFDFPKQEGANRIPYTNEYIPKVETIPTEVKPETDNAKPTTVPTPVATQVPTSTKAYSLDELGKAAMGLMDMGKQQDLVNLLSQFGVQALPQLPKEKYSEFALQLRQMGADI